MLWFLKFMVWYISQSSWFGHFPKVDGLVSFPKLVVCFILSLSFGQGTKPLLLGKGLRNQFCEKNEIEFEFKFAFKIEFDFELEFEFHQLGKGSNSSSRSS